mgnify:CR=1 FL=1
MIHHISRLRLEREELTLFVFGDLQYGADGFNLEAWKEFEHEFKTTPNAWALGLGDYQDFARPTMRGRLEASASHDDSIKKQLDKMVILEQDKLLNLMGFLEGRCIGLHEGHHTWNLGSGIKTDQRIASALKAPFLGWMASTRLCLAYGKAKNNDHKRMLIHTIVSMHGNANARRTGGAAAWLENNIMPGFLADHYIQGHACKHVAWEPNERKEIRREGPAGTIMRIPKCMQVGGFHSGYTDGWQSSYVERFGFTPQPLGYGVIRFKRIERQGLQELNGTPGKRNKTLLVEQFNRTIGGVNE